MMIIKSISFVCITLSCLCASTLTYGWSVKGHEKITHDALELLSKEEKDTYHKWVDELFASANGEFNISHFGSVKNSDKNEPQRCKLAPLGSWPDTIRDKKLGDVFGLFDLQLPESLKRYKNQSTSRWHYYNNEYVASSNQKCLDKKCKFENKGQLVDAMIALDSALQEPLNNKQKMLVLSFLIHLISDAHQPLHSVSLIRDDHKSDRGGNDFCVKKSFFSCQQSLHKIWDDGFGVFEQETLLADKLSGLPLRRLWFFPSIWVQESFELAESVYQLEENKEPNDSYRLMASRMAQSRASMAVTRIAFYLQVYLAEEKPVLPTYRGTR